MIPRRYIQEWRQHHPWPQDSQVEQDLVISRALVELYNHPALKDVLAFRGRTALGKLYLNPQPRYSEDIDLVQIPGGPIRPIIDGIREALSFLGVTRIRQKANNNTLRFSFDSEIPPVVNMKLKIEINCREHFTVLGYKDTPFSVENGWFSGRTTLKTYQVSEMAGTKLRALYQRSKGRDLYDLYRILLLEGTDQNQILVSYRQYMGFVVDHVPTKREYLLNLEAKHTNPEFRDDMAALLPPNVEFDFESGYQLIYNFIEEKYA